MLSRIKTFFLHSVTILWARLIALVGVLLAISGPFLDLVSAPAIKEQIQGVLDPKYVPFYAIAFAIMTELARRRSLSAASEKEEA
jgi:hypothetical protein